MRKLLYEQRFEHDACGVGFVAKVSGEPDHELLRLGLVALGRLEHRGATAADGKSGDGVGVLTQVPRRLLAEELARRGEALGDGEPLGVGMVFAPPGEWRTEATLEAVVEAQGLRVAGWRDVPVDAEVLGEQARRELPVVRQLLVRPGKVEWGGEFDRRLYLARKAFERAGVPGYVCSLSSRVVVYKALGAAHQLARFYADLCDPRFETALVVFHQRYSTNTLPSWAMVQPFRLLAHNGEVNTLWANQNWMRVRETELAAELRPLLPPDGSDSASLDAALELLTHNGRDVVHALRMLVPPAWEEADDELPPEVRAFHHSHAALLEPWDGPAALAFSDGLRVGASLDRNGLRPLRYQITADGLVVAGSEAGMVDLDPEAVVERGRLGPGQVLLVDLEAKRILRDAELRHELAAHHTAPRWSTVALPEPAGAEHGAEPPLDALHRLYGVSREELNLVLPPMVQTAREAVWSMGDDTPIPPLARSPQSVYAFFRQRFAQVTNPAIDPLREGRVMSLRTWLGPRPSLFNERDRTRLFELSGPILNSGLCRALREQESVPVQRLDCIWRVQDTSLPDALDLLCVRAEVAARAGAGLLVLSDRGANAERAPIPMALAVGAVHHRLVDSGLRTRVGLVAEAGDCWDVHHAAVLVGYGATVVCPWLALRTAREADPEQGEQRLVEALSAGLLKVMSKMGISTIASYRGGQMFEALGLGDEVVERCFAGTPSRIGGLGFAAIAESVARRHAAAFAAEAELPDYGRIRYRRGEEAEQHAWQPLAVRALQKSVGAVRGKSHGQPDATGWGELHQLGAAAAPSQLRDLLELVPAGPAVPLEEVEPAREIARRFVTSAMSLGALSPEAHRTLTIAMNRLGGRSNSGEGGEDPAVYAEAAGDRLDNKIKQVASGRFGVTAEYLARAEELEIKVAQGSKPGEGGQLPGHKVTGLIARLRHAQPGISLISPPPHHDIYSIEDLAQLIYDLKAVNPRAAVGVKLVAEAGVGTVAAGVAKARADYVIVSGANGGTGASPLTSIKQAGVPWELGVAEAQQVLMRNGLRGRVRLRTDGGLVTGRDVMVAALLGAEEFGFATGPLVAMGCDMARQCHLNTCPAGIATQDPELRRRFRGSPDMVERYFLQVAEDVRGLLASLGLRRLEDAVGRVELLRQASAPAGLDLSRLLGRVEGGARRCEQPRNGVAAAGDTLDAEVLPELAEAIERGVPATASRAVGTHHRSVGAALSGAIAHRWGGDGLPPGTVRLRLSGSAGQSFGAFAARGLRLELEGEANDYVGKGLSGGELVLRPVGSARREPQRHVILGNVTLYGATSGALFAAGRAGERFAVRNSGATAVVEGVGDHGCEYMTGGCVVVLGRTGWNFGAGMTGGVAFVWDETGLFPRRVNADSVACAPAGDADRERLLALVREHHERTGSTHAAALLSRWDTEVERFWTVAPRVGAPAPISAPERSDADSLPGIPR